MKHRFAWALLVVAALGASAQTQIAPAAPAAIATTPAPQKENAALLAKLYDFGQLARYRAYNAALPATEPGRVVFFGDSITDAWVRDGGKFFPGKPYVNRGISGQTTPQMLVRFREDVLELHPEAVVILAGTNDIAGNTGPTTNAVIEGNLATMAELARANGIRVIIASILPVAKYPWKPELEPAPRIQQINAWLASFCKQKGYTYLDYYTAMADADGGMKPGISIDGVHPNAAGYAIMEPLASAALAQ
jgi:lysophospholipase L1-like esterase